MRSRYELKYVVSVPRAAAIREFVRRYLGPDRQAGDPDDPAYRVRSLYLDSPDLRLCRATVDGLKNRFKLRIRWYDEKDEHPVFCEIKRRVNDQIFKRRAAVLRSAVPALLAGHQPSRDDLCDVTRDDHFDDLLRFCHLRNRCQATGRLYVAYEREAWRAEDPVGGGVTFDHGVRGRWFDRRFVTGETGTWVRPVIRGTIVELKYRAHLPRWMAHLIRTFDLVRVSMPKYVECAQAAARTPGPRPRPHAVLHP